MSLFDVIRYPVSDIYNDEELAKIPEEITIPWLQECYNKLGRPDGLANGWQSKHISHFIGLMIFKFSMDKEPEVEIYIRKHFAHTLRERIKEYDNL